MADTLDLPVFPKPMAFSTSVEVLRRQYLQLVDPGELWIPLAHEMRSPDIQAELYDALFAPKAVRYPPPHRYQCRVLKRLLEAMEEAIEDPEEDVGSP